MSTHLWYILLCNQVSHKRAVDDSPVVLRFFGQGLLSTTGGTTRTCLGFTRIDGSSRLFDEALKSSAMMVFNTVGVLPFVFQGTQVSGHLSNCRMTIASSCGFLRVLLQKEGAEVRVVG